MSGRAAAGPGGPPAPGGRDWTRSLWIAPALIILGGFPYALSGSLHSPFVFDDHKLVAENPSIRDLGSILEIFDVASKRWEEEPLRANYRPVRFLSYALDYQVSRWLFGSFRDDQPPVFVFHLSNLAFHLLNALLVLSIARRLLGDGKAALVLAALFALHPIQTEAVVYISGRRDVLSLFFFLAALRLCLGRAPGGTSAGAGAFDRGEPAGDASWAALLGAPLLFLAGLLTKEMVVTLPGAVLLVDFLRRARPGPRRVALHIVLCGLATAYALWVAGNPRLVAAPPGGSHASALLTAPRYVLRYLVLLLFPFSQSLDYSFDAIPISHGAFDPWTTLPALLLAAALLGAGLWALGRRWALPALGILWFLGTLLPVLQIVPSAERFAERFLYLPGLGILLLAAGAFRRLDRVEPLLSRPAAGAAALLLLGLTYSRCLQWRSELSIWESAAAAQPRCARAQIGLGNALRDLGGGRLRDAVIAYGLAIELLEGDPEGLIQEPLRRGYLLQARQFRADALTRLGGENPDRFRQASRDYQWLLEQKDVDGEPIAESKRYTVVYYHLALCRFGLRDWEAAEKAFRIVIERGEPPTLVGSSRAYIGRMRALLEDPGAAVPEFREAYRIACEHSTLADRSNLAREYADVLIGAREYGEALKMLDEVLAAVAGADDPLLKSQRQLLRYRRARVLDLQGEIAAEVRALEEILADDPGYEPALMTLAGIEENRGDLDRARKLYGRVLELHPEHSGASQAILGLELKRKLAGRSASAGSEEEKLRLLDGLLEQGDSHFDRGQYLAAQDYYRKVADAEPDGANRGRRARALRRLGHTARELRKLTVAEEFFHAALEADPECVDAYLDLADLRLEKRQDREAAIHYYRQYLAGLPAGKPGESHASFNLALLIEESAPGEAVALLRRAREAGDRRPEVDLRLGRLLTRLGRWEEALAAFEAYLAQEVPIEEKAAVRRLIDTEILPRLPGGEALPPPKRQ